MGTDGIPFIGSSVLRIFWLVVLFITVFFHSGLFSKQSGIYATPLDVKSSNKSARRSTEYDGSKSTGRGGVRRKYSSKTLLMASSKNYDCTISKYWHCNVERIRFAALSKQSAIESANNTETNDILRGSAQIYDFNIYYLNKVDPVSGSLFVSATLRWRFRPGSASSAKLASHGFLIVVVRNEAQPKDLAAFRVTLTPASHHAMNKTHPIIYIRFDNNDKIDSREDHGDDGARRGGGGATPPRLSLSSSSDNLLAFGHTYTFKIFKVESHSSGENTSNGETNVDFSVSHRRLFVTSKTFTFASLLDFVDTAGCASRSDDASAAAILQRKEMASRWSTSIREITFYPLHFLLNVSFYGAPPSYCIRGYTVELWFHDVLVQDKKFVSKDDLVPIFINNSAIPLSLVGSVTFGGLKREAKYTIRIIPNEYYEETGGDCMCEFAGKCGCVTIRSNLFALSNIYDFNDSGNVATSSAYSRIPLPSADDGDGRITIYYWTASCAFLLLTLILLGLMLLLFIRQSAASAKRKRNLFLVYNERSTFLHSGRSNGNGRKPLIDNGGSDAPLTILILNAETRNADKVEWLARMLESIVNGDRLRVLYDRWETRGIEENLQQWVQDSLVKANKVILFHGERAVSLVSQKEQQRSTVAKKFDNGDVQRDLHLSGCDDGRMERTIFDDVFYTAYSLLSCTDPRIIHAKWNPTDQMLATLSENVYLIPRDIKYMLIALKQYSAVCRIKEYEKEFEELSATNNKSSNGFRATMPSVRKPHTPLHGITILAGNNDAPKANIRENNVSTAGELLIPRTEAVNLSGGVDCVRTSLISPSSSSDQMLVGAEDKMDQRKLAALTQGNDRDVGIDDDEEITTMDSGIAAISCYSSAPLLQAGIPGSNERNRCVNENFLKEKAGLMITRLPDDRNAKDMEMVEENEEKMRGMVARKSSSTSSNSSTTMHNSNDSGISV